MKESDLLLERDIEELLQGVSQGDVETEAEDYDGDTDELSDELSHKYVSYDSVGLGTLPEYEIMNEKFKCMLETDICREFDTSGAVKIGSVRILRFIDYIGGLMFPVLLRPFRSKERYDKGLIMLDSHLIKCLTMEMFDDKCSRRSVEKITKLIVNNINRIWKPYSDKKYHIRPLNAKPQFCQIALPLDLVLVSNFSTVFGSFQIVYPYKTIQQL